MSHKAVNWALEQVELKPGPWIVLIKLADRHNKDTLRCDPNQALLASDCNMSRATLNRHLDDLEAAGLLRRVPRLNPQTKKQLSTFYILGLDFDAPPEIEFAVSQVETRGGEDQTENSGVSRVSNCDMGAVSQKQAKPCLKIVDSRVSNCDTNLVIKPVKEPDDSARGDFGESFRTASGLDVSDCEINTALRRWRFLGLSEEQAIEAVRVATKRASSPPNSISYFEKPIAQRALKNDKVRLVKANGGGADETSNAARLAYERILAKETNP